MYVMVGGKWLLPRKHTDLEPVVGAVVLHSQHVIVNLEDVAVGGEQVCKVKGVA